MHRRRMGCDVVARTVSRTVRRYGWFGTGKNWAAPDMLITAILLLLLIAISNTLNFPVLALQISKSYSHTQY